MTTVPASAVSFSNFVHPSEFSARSPGSHSNLCRISVEYRVDYHFGPLIHFVKYAPQVFADHAQHDDHVNEQKCDQRGDGSKSHDRNLALIVRYDVGKAECGDQKSNPGHQPDWGRRISQRDVQENVALRRRAGRNNVPLPELDSHPSACR